jgi:hypothetical protein
MRRLGHIPDDSHAGVAIWLALVIIGAALAYT